MTIDTSKLKRYKPGYVHSNDGPGYISMIARDDGEYVRLEDVKAITSALEQALTQQRGAEWSDDLRAVLDAASEASQVPLMWLANQDFSPEQTRAWLCEAVDATVEEGAFSGSLHQIAEEGTGHVVAFTGCGPKSGANAKFLIGCAHFILKHREALSDHAATVAELRAKADAAERRVWELEKLMAAARRAIGDHHAPNDCYATGPLTGYEFLDLVQCPACAFLEQHEALTGADPT